MNPGRALSQLLQARTRTSSSSLSAALTNYNLSSTGPASLALTTSSHLRPIYTSSTPSPLARSRPTMTIFKHSHDPTSTGTAESSNVSSRRESVVSTDSSATVHPGGTDSSVNGNDGVPPGEVIQAEIAAARAIPSSLLTSLGAWWNSSEQTARDSETRLLKRIPFFRTPHEPDVQPTPENPNPITARVTQVPLKDNARSSKGGRMINMCSFLTPETKGGKEAVVLTHGYGAGLAFFYRNLQEMAETSASVGRAAYAIDWLGMGRSSRPDPKELVSGRGTSAKERVEKAERFFTDSLDEWREKMGIEKMTLIGHSLGGYIVSAYALKYPERVDRLVLLSPAGIVNHPEKGEDIVPDAEIMDNETREYIDSSLDHQAQQQRQNPRRPGISSAPTEYSITTRPGVGREESTQSVAPTDFEADKEAKRGNHGWWKKAVYYMWEGGVSPFGLVRKLGPVGPMLVAKYSTRRFAALPEEDIADLHDYVWTLTSSKGSSEYAITHLLAPGAHARWPIADRVHKLNIPIAFVYGDHDWMDIKGGYDSVASMRRAGNNHGKVIEISHAGHHVYLDNARRTNAVIHSEIITAARRSRERAERERAMANAA